jgi:hypothetical protein
VGSGNIGATTEHSLEVQFHELAGLPMLEASIVFNIALENGHIYSSVEIG